MFCIYVFSDEFGVPKYIGKAKNLSVRIKQHLTRDRFRYDTWFYRWLNKQIREEKEFFIDVLEEVNSLNWKDREKFWIKHIKENNFPLTNMTEGGDGNNNQVFSKESIEKRRLKLIGRKRSDDVREKISRSNLGKTISEETKRKLSLMNKGKPCSEIVKEKLSLKVEQYDLDGNLLNTFPSLTAAAVFLKCRKSSLSNAIKRNKRNTYKNCIWKYCK